MPRRTRDESASRFLSLVLRHQPGRIGLALDAQGWADLDTLVDLANAHGTPLTRDGVLRIVAGNDKQRFAIDATGTRIRANQGHSVRVDLGLEPTAPPPVLYHGTATRFLHAIRKRGLVPGPRRHVHLADATGTATAVGARHGVPAVLGVDAHAMHRDGHAFFLSANGVWLVDAVPPRYITFPGGHSGPSKDPAHRGE